MSNTPLVESQHLLLPDGQIIVGTDAGGYPLVLTWRTGPPGGEIAIETWGLQSARCATVRLINSAGTVRTGAVAGGTVDWSDDAREAYGQAWLDGQAHHIVQGLARRWGSV